MEDHLSDLGYGFWVSGFLDLRGMDTGFILQCFPPSKRGDLGVLGPAPHLGPGIDVEFAGYAARKKLKHDRWTTFGRPVSLSVCIYFLGRGFEPPPCSQGGSQVSMK